jgi:hypothetical protein
MHASNAETIRDLNSPRQTRSETKTEALRVGQRIDVLTIKVELHRLCPTHDFGPHYRVQSLKTKIVLGLIMAGLNNGKVLFISAPKTVQKTLTESQKWCRYG